jgi:hypothetical protein
MDTLASILAWLCGSGGLLIVLGALIVFVLACLPSPPE